LAFGEAKKRVLMSFFKKIGKKDPKLPYFERKK